MNSTEFDGIYCIRRGSDITELPSSWEATTFSHRVWNVELNSNGLSPDAALTFCHRAILSEAARYCLSKIVIIHDARAASQVLDTLQANAEQLRGTNWQVALITIQEPTVHSRFSTDQTVEPPLNRIKAFGYHVSSAMQVVSEVPETASG